MSRGKHPVGRTVKSVKADDLFCAGRVAKAINIPSGHVVTAIELMMPVEHEGQKYGRGYYAMMDGEDIVKVVDFKLFRQTYLPICTWHEYDAGWNENDDT